MPDQNEMKPDEGALRPVENQLLDTWYTIEDLVEKFKRSVATINRWREKHGLVYTKIDGLVLINKTDLDNFLKKLRRSGKISTSCICATTIEKSED